MHSTSDHLNAEEKKEEALHLLIEESRQLLQLNCNLVRRERFGKDIFCPHCLNEKGKKISNYIKYGFVRGTGWQRYHCRQCQHIFSDLTRTFFHRSRNVDKWPYFIQYVFVDHLPLKEVAARLELHINTIYTWNKKISAFFEQFLPKRQFQPSDEKNYDYTTVRVKHTKKGRVPASDHQTLASDVKTQSVPAIPVTIAVNRENPAHTLLTIGNYGTNVAHSNKHTKTCSKQLSVAVAHFLSYYAGKRGLSARRLPFHLTNLRMIMLINTLNPAILAMELFKICLDKDNLYLSKRLIKKLI